MAVGVALELSVMRVKTQTFLKLIYGDIINMQFFATFVLNQARVRAFTTISESSSNNFVSSTKIERLFC